MTPECVHLEEHKVKTLGEKRGGGGGGGRQRAACQEWDIRSILILDFGPFLHTLLRMKRNSNVCTPRPNVLAWHMDSLVCVLQCQPPVALDEIAACC